MIAAPSQPLTAIPSSDVEALAYAAEWLIDFKAKELCRFCVDALDGFHAIDRDCHDCAQLNRILPVGTLWLNRAQHHLNRRIDAALRDSPRIDSEQAALALLKSCGQELQHASDVLHMAAESMKGFGKAREASVLKFAAQRAHQAAEGLT